MALDSSAYKQKLSKTPMDNQNYRNPSSVPETDSLGGLNSLSDGNLVSQYASDTNMYPIESLEVHDQQVISPATMSHPTPHRLVFSKRKAMIVSVVITLGVTILTAISMLTLVRHTPNDLVKTVKQQDLTIKNADESNIPKELQGAAESLLVNGDVVTRGNFKVSSGGYVTVIKVQDATADQTITLPNGSGTICVTTNNCDYASSTALATLQGQVAALSQVTIPTAGVAQLNGQKGSVGIQGSLNQITVNTSGGVITLSTPQNLDANANVQFGNLSVGAGGTIKANKLLQTGAGNSVDIDAGSDMITFTAGGRVFQLPNSGPASQTICTTGASCATGSGSAVILAPGSAQVDGTADASIFINDVGGGHLVELQSGGVDKLTVANNGDTTVGGTLTVASLGNGFVKSSGGLLSVVSAIDLNSADVVNSLPVTNGGTGAATLATNGVLIGNGVAAVTSVTAGGVGQCLISTAGTPSFQVCPGSGGVTSVNGQNGVLTVVGTANQVSVATSSGTITLSLPQNIDVTATPVFDGLTISGLGNGPVRSTAGLLSTGNINLGSEVSGVLGILSGGTGATTAVNARANLGAAANGVNGDITSTTALNTITPSGALTIGATSQNLSLQGNASASFSAGSGANITTLNFAAPSGTNTLTLPALTGTVCISTGNCTAAGAAGGDLTGSYPNPTIAKLQGTNLNISGPTAGQVLIYNATNGRWENRGVIGDITLSETGAASINNDAVTTNKIADANVTNAKLANSSLTVSAGAGLSGGGSVALGASTSLAVLYGSTANTAVQGNTALIISPGTGLTGGGTITLGAGGTSTLNVTYGSSAGTAVEGNKTLTCASGTGNLTGGGNIVTLGAGGTCNNLTITNSPVFTGTLAVQGATATIGADSQQGSVVLYDGGTGAAAQTGTVQVIGSLTQNTTYILPDPGLASVNICLSTGNCAGAGGGVTGTGTNGKIAKFNSTGSTIADSTLSESGSTVTATGNLIIQGANSLALGTSSSFDGSIKFNNAAGTHSVTLQAPATDPAANLTFKLPNAYGANGDCLKSDGAGTLTLTGCTGGAGGGVTSINGQTGVTSIANASGSGGIVTLNDASTIGKGIAQFNSTNFTASLGIINTIQDIDTTATPTFAGLSLSGLGNGLVISSAGLLSSGAVDRNSSTYFNNGLSVSNGGTGLGTAPSNGQLLIGNGTGYSLGTLSNSDGTVLITNGAGSINISVPRADQCATCADFTLSNLADIVAINKSLLPAAAGAINLGGSSVPYSMLYLSGTSASPASNNFTITGAATSARTINLPDADGTLCLKETCIQLQTGSPPGVAQTGNINLNGTITVTNLTVGGTATINTLTPAASTGLVLGATGSGQTTSLQGSAITFTNGAATYTFNSAASGSQTICDTSGNCAGTGGGVIASGGSAYNLPVFTGSNTLANSIIGQDAGGTTATVTGILKVTGANLTGTGALTVASTGGSNALNLSSGSGVLGLTGSTATIQRVGSSLTLDVNSGAASTLTVTNSNVSNVANLSVEGGVSIGSGQAYKINGTDINTAGTLNNVAYLNQNNTFTAVGNTSFGGTLTGGTYNGQTISSTAALTGTLSIAGANALTIGQASTNSGAIVFKTSAGANTVTLKAPATNPASSFNLTLPASLGTTGDCLQQVDGTGTLGFVSCAAGLGGSGTVGKIAYFTGTSAIGDSLLSQSGSTVSILGSSNFFQVDGTITSGVNGASGSAGKIVLNDGSNPGRAVTLQSQQAGTGYTLLLPTTADVGSTCLTLANVSAGVNKIVGGSCAAGGTGGNITATGSTSGHLLVATNSGPSYTAAASLIQDNGSGVSINTAPQASYVLTVGSANKFNVTDGGQLEIGTTGANPLTLSATGAISNLTTLSATGLLQTTANGQALSLSGAPTNIATQSLFSLGNAIAGGNSVANGGTYLGINAPSSGAGSVADFINFQANGTSKLKVDINGNITGGTYNGVTIGGTGAITSGGYTLTLTGNSTLNQDLTTTSAVQFTSLALGTALAPAYGGTGSDTSGALAGASLLFNATTGKFEANKITSSDSSLTITSSDGHVDLSVASCVTCASNDLSNLAVTTNLNSTLQAQANVDAGSASSPFRNLYISGSSASRSSNHFELTGTATASRVITLPNADGTVCLTTTCVTLQGSSSTPQTGYINVSNDIIAGGNLSVGGTATINTIAPAASTALVLGATGAGQTSTLQGNSISFVDGTHTYVFSDNGTGTHTLCDDTGNCAGSGGGALVSGGSAFNLPVFSNANTLVNSLISQDAGAGATTATVGGKLVVAATNTSGSSLAVTNTALNSNNSSLAQLSFTNANSGASSTTVNGLAISPTGSTNANANANTLNGIKLNNVTPVTNNNFYALNVGTGYNDILRYNNTSLINGSGFVQNNAFDASLLYSNLTKVGTITAGTWQGTAIADAYVDDNLTVSSAGTVDWTALNNYPAACGVGQAVTQLGDTITCTTFAAGSGSGNYIQNQSAASQTVANYWISGSGRTDTSLITPTVTSAAALSITSAANGDITVDANGTGKTLLNDSVVLAATKTLTITGDTTANRPVTPTEGTIYYDTTTKQLLTYANGKWQADRSTSTKIVASGGFSGCTGSAPVASLNPDGADFVTNSCTSAQTAINNAIAALPAGGGTVYLMEGTYIVDGAITLPTNVTLTGAGKTTILKLKDGINANIKLIDAGSGTAKVVSNLKLDGNSSNNSSGAQTGVNFGSIGSTTTPGMTVDNLDIENFRNEAIIGTTGARAVITNNFLVANGGGGSIYLNGINSSVVSNNVVQTTTGSAPGIFTRGDGSQVTDNRITNAAGAGIDDSGKGDTISGNTITTTGSDGIVFGAYNNYIVTNNTISTSGRDGIRINISATNSLVSGNTITNSASNGINVYISNSNNTISNNTISASGTVTTTSSGIIVDNSSNSNTITDNNITDTAGTGYAIYVKNGTANYLADNYYSGTGAASINDTATGTVFGGQLNGSGDYQIQAAGTIKLLNNTTVSGNLSATTLTSTVATGTAPITVSSTTLVANLNADLLDGQQGSYYQNASNINAGTLGVAQGGTGAGTLTQYGVLFGNGTAAVGVTAVGTSGQCLIGNTGAAPTWGVCNTASLQNVYDNSGTPATILLSNAKDFVINAQDTATDSNIIFNLQCTTCSANGGRFAVQNAGVDMFTVNPNGQIIIGSASNGTVFAAGTHELSLAGSAQHAKKIILTPEYAGAVLDATSDTGGAIPCSSNFNGSMTSGYSGDASPRQSYYNWVSAAAAASCYDVVVQVPIPSDWSAWSASNPWSMFTYNSAGTNSTSVYVEAIDTANTIDTAYSGYVGVSSGTTLASTNLTTPTGTYTAGGYMTLKIRMFSTTTANNVRIGNITLNYLSKY